MLEATSSTSLHLSLSLGNQNGCNTHKFCAGARCGLPSTASLSCKRHKLIMSRKKRHSLRQLSLFLSHSLCLTLTCLWPEQTLFCFCFAFARELQFFGLVWSGPLRWILCQGGIISQSCKVKCLIKSLPSERMRTNSNFSLNVAHSKLCVELGTGFGGLSL